ncbi:MAG: aspartate carbamoyltransferase [Patescibacteria group bacterium]
MRFKHIISVKQFLDIDILDKIFQLADEMEKNDKANKLQYSLKGKILATVFYEPSTRTRFSFESAMHKLGGSVITTESAPHFSSVTKGETLQDTIKVINGYADAIVLRHQEEGSAKIASEVSSVPIINAGDGIGEHPTQALLDLYTIKREFGKIDNLKIALIGDLLYGRTIHSLIYLLALYKKVKIYLVSPKQLKLPEECKDYLTQKKIEFEELTDLNEVLDKIDVLYVTRIQKERFKSEQEYGQAKDAYIIDRKIVNQLKENTIIMHPLPRVNEISSELDGDKRAVYFRQAQNGLYIRMALLHLIFNNE